MKSKIVLFLILISPFVLISAQEIGITELNQRAMDDLNSFPALSIYYGLNALDKNSGEIEATEYINSLFIIAKGYNNIEEYNKRDIYLNKAFDFYKSRNFVDIVNNFLIYYLNILVEGDQKDKVLSIINDVTLIEKLDDRTRMYLAMIRIKVESLWSDKFISETYKTLEESGFTDLLTELKLEEARVLEEENRQKSLSIYRDIMSSTSEYYALKAHYGYWRLTKYTSYLEEAVLLSSFVSDYKLIVEVLTEMKGVYRRSGEYKNLNVVSDRLAFITDKRSNFLLTQHKELYQYGYEGEQMALKLEVSQNQNILFRSIIMGAAGLIVLFIILLFIQSYRLRRSH